MATERHRSRTAGGWKSGQRAWAGTRLQLAGAVRPRTGHPTPASWILDTRGRAPCSRPFHPRCPTTLLVSPRWQQQLHAGSQGVTHRRRAKQAPPEAAEVPPRFTDGETRAAALRSRGSQAAEAPPSRLIRPATGRPAGSAAEHAALGLGAVAPSSTSGVEMT